jgi:hypothetical protein
MVMQLTSTSALQVSVACHGADGNNLSFKSEEDPEYITLARSIKATKACGRIRLVCTTVLVGR